MFTVNDIITYILSFFVKKDLDIQSLIDKQLIEDENNMFINTEFIIKD
jgi:hypothetical protein